MDTGIISNIINSIIELILGGILGIVIVFGSKFLILLVKGDIFFGKPSPELKQKAEQYSTSCLKNSKYKW